MSECCSYKIGDNIISPLGQTSKDVYEAIKRGDSKAELHDCIFGLPEPFFGSLLERELIDSLFLSLYSGKIRYTYFEKIAILSAFFALEKLGIDPSRPDLFFVLSTTKGNIDLLENPDGFDSNRVDMSVSAQMIGDFFGNPNGVVVVSNACTSGVAAQIYADEKLKRNDKYRYAVVIGAEVLCKFIVSGFQSFKALSSQRCKPFDKNRCGLNLGEAAATIVLEKSENPIDGCLSILGSGNRNDANHISGPSRTGEGLFLSIKSALRNKNVEGRTLSFINAHGTATLYNDDMESWAIFRSDLQNIPTNSLKGYFGHTLGAAGVLECILSGCALQEKRILSTCGLDEEGTVKKITIAHELLDSNKGDSFLKIISGFGGSNAAIIYG